MRVWRRDVGGKSKKDSGSQAIAVAIAVPSECAGVPGCTFLLGVFARHPLLGGLVFLPHRAPSLAVSPRGGLMAHSCDVGRVVVESPPERKQAVAADPPIKTTQSQVGNARSN